MTTFLGRLVNWLEARRTALSGAVLLVSGSCVVVGWEINAVHDAVVGSGVIQVLILAAILDLSRTYSQTRKEAPEVEGLSPALRDSLAIMERPSGGADAVASIVALTGLNTLPLLRVLAAAGWHIKLLLSQAAADDDRFSQNEISAALVRIRAEAKLAQAVEVKLYPGYPAMHGVSLGDVAAIGWYSYSPESTLPHLTP